MQSYIFIVVVYMPAECCSSAEDEFGGHPTLISARNLVSEEERLRVKFRKYIHVHVSRRTKSDSRFF
jgi:hypothetical protein